MATYIWELGIDWNAIEDPTNGKSYMPAGFIQPGEPSLIKRPHADSTDIITFRIFDVTTGNPQVTGIGSFTINPRAAVLGQQPNIDPLSSLEPQVTSLGTQSSVYFEGGPFPCWGSEVSVTEAAANHKFLLTFFVQALGPSSSVRTFVHDPEMVVGPFG